MLLCSKTSIKHLIQDYKPEGLDALIDTIKELATDSNKSRSKKDRKEQCHIFRDIMRGVEEGDPPSEKIKFGQEVLLLDYWYKKTQYDWFSKVARNNFLQLCFIQDNLPRYSALVPTIISALTTC